MLVNELISKFDFHDSNVIALHHKENNLVIKLDLCMWKQKNYNEGDDELKEVFIEFTNVEKYVWDSKSIIQISSSPKTIFTLFPSYEKSNIVS